MLSKIKIINPFFTGIDKKFKIHMEPQKFPDSQNNLDLKKKYTTGVITILVLKMYYRVAVIRTIWCKVSSTKTDI